MLSLLVSESWFSIDLHYQCFIHTFNIHNLRTEEFISGIIKINGKECCKDEFSKATGTGIMQ